MTPSEALLGATLPNPGDWSHPTRAEAVTNTAEARRARIDRARARQVVFARRMFPEDREAPIHFNQGDQVLVRAFPGTHTTFGPTWEGPFPVVAVKGEGVYEIDRNGSQFAVHIDDIRPAPGPEPEADNDADLPQLCHETQDRNPAPAPEPDATPEVNQAPPTRDSDDSDEDAEPEVITTSAQVHVHLTTPTVEVQDLPDDEGGPDEARTQEGGTPVVGLYP